jgi:transposase
MRFDLRGEDRALLRSPLPKARRSTPVNDCKIVNAIFNVLRAAMPWRDCGRVHMFENGQPRSASARRIG